MNRYKHTPNIPSEFSLKNTCKIEVLTDETTPCGYSIQATKKSKSLRWPLSNFFSVEFHDTLIEEGDGEFLYAMWHDIADEVERYFLAETL